ncbi:NAD(P)-dependent alcohol dehydrogenase [Spirosoma taeanense]|uniref:NAD(P)-dependent alcohol dehydrogenase n=1 Tax=Spirosoma taeanense TaxID=2735870 RepID=A0A6M5Y9S5_9BACT|nr:NAD(P)-dependent alcohol dehydrogenase [Spirosoma taeanense]QJW90106.1 NAD(P)-dependent alcohol dehydrogenase [Spirosoma taeanense]
MLHTKGYAAHSADSPLSSFQFERREVGAKDIQIEILYCGICHTDIHMARNDWGLTNYPIVPGHEIVGQVKKVGSDVTKFKEGDYAAVGCLVDSCRTCSSCNDGLEQYCENGWVATYGWIERDGKTPTYGGYSSQIVVDEHFVLKVADNLPLERVAPLLCAGITTYSPLKEWKIRKGHRLGVVGLGGLGHMAVKLAAAMGIEVTILSTSPEKEVDARQLGAQNFVLTTDEAALASVQNYFDFIIDTVAAKHDLQLYLTTLKRDGTLILVGVPPQNLEINCMGLCFPRKRVVGSFIGGLPETQEMLDFCAEHNVLSDVEIISMSEINDAYDRLLKGDVKYRFVIDMATL